MNTVNKLPQLNALKTFETVSRHLSMVSAARELCLTHGAVSRQIAQLESQLDLKLFVRRNRAIFLTREGVQLQETCVAVFSGERCRGVDSFDKSGCAVGVVVRANDCHALVDCTAATFHDFAP